MASAKMANYVSYQGGSTPQENSFEYLCNTIGTNVRKISQNVSSITKMVNQLQTSQDSLDLRSSLRQLQHYTQQLAKDTSSMLINLMKIPIHDQPSKKLIRDRLSDEYITTLNAFQATQKLAAQKTKEDVKKYKSQHSDEAIDMMLPMPPSNNEGIQKQTFKQEQHVSEQELRELQEREMDIRQLESDILDVNQIFKQVGSIIHEQGTIVDSIESSVENTAHNVEAGRQELRQAETFKDKVRKKKVYIAIVVVIVILILILIFRN